MAEIRLDALASSINFIAGFVLAIDAFTTPWKTKVVRGGERLFDGIKESGKTDLLDDPTGKPSSNAQSAGDWADRRTRKLALVGFSLLAGGFALDLYSKVISNPLLFQK